LTSKRGYLIENQTTKLNSIPVTSRKSLIFFISNFGLKKSCKS
jgi:hypothetical protein